MRSSGSNSALPCRLLGCLARQLFRSGGGARLSLCCFCGWLFCNPLLPHRLLGSLTSWLFRSCGRARSLSLCCFSGQPFCSHPLFLWQCGRWLRLPFCRCRLLSCCANRGTREGPNHRSNDGETHDRPGYSTSNCATQGAPSGARGFVSRVLFLVVVHVLPPKFERRRSTSRAYLSTSAVVLFTGACRHLRTTFSRRFAPGRVPIGF